MGRLSRAWLLLSVILHTDGTKSAHRSVCAQAGDGQLGALGQTVVSTSSSGCDSKKGEPMLKWPITVGFVADTIQSSQWFPPRYASSWHRLSSAQTLVEGNNARDKEYTPPWENYCTPARNSFWSLFKRSLHDTGSKNDAIFARAVDLDCFLCEIKWNSPPYQAGAP